MKRPIFCVARGAAKELIDFTGTGITSFSDDKKNIVESFNKTLNLNVRERFKMADNGFEFYKKNFKSETIIREFLNFIWYCLIQSEDLFFTNSKKMRDDWLY